MRLDPQVYAIDEYLCVYVCVCVVYTTIYLQMSIILVCAALGKQANRFQRRERLTTTRDDACVRTYVYNEGEGR